ncbi:MAG: aldehyde dehydrogenase family protein [Candidatus Latescibacteria bacterium]|nr:aldehyde dehydrogenase family protein [Candidatus Latescibacterota bacterium]
MSDVQPVLIDGQWRAADQVGTFAPDNPATKAPTGETYPVSSLADVEAALQAGARAAEALLSVPAAQIAQFLERYADRIEARRDDLTQMANAESGLPVEPRLDGIELPRTTDQLRQAAAAARDGSWALPTIDTAAGIRSVYGSLEGAVAVFGPNNFPFAFNSVAGGDFAAAIAAGNPVIGKGNSSHPGTTRLLAEEALEAVKETGLPTAMVQLIYRTDHATGEKLVSHPLIGATGYTGSRGAGLVLKGAADRAGKPIYMELSSINPVYILPGALAERGAELVDEFATSCLMGTGQFCTNPGIVVLLKGAPADEFVAQTSAKFGGAPVGTLLSGAVEKSMDQSVAALQAAGAQVLVGGQAGGGNGYSYNNTLLQVDGSRFLDDPEALQEEAFGNESLLVMADDADQAVAIARSFEGNLTGALYSDTQGGDDALYDQIAPILRRKVGRLLNDKMPTGVAVSAAMNHGGPYPATGHPGFTAVGIPGSLLRFAMLQSFDNVRPHRLPASLQDQNPGGTWRLIDGAWSQASVES